MFILATLGGWLQDARLGVAILAAHWVSALLVGLLSKYFSKETAPSVAPPLTNNPTIPIHRVLGQSLQDAASAMLVVCGCMVLGTVTAALIAALLPHLPDALMAALQTLLEVTGGLSAIVALRLAPAWTAALFCAGVSFGGLSILSQNMAFLQQLGVTWGRLLLARAVHAVVGFGLCLCFSFLLLAI